MIKEIKILIVAYAAALAFLLSGCTSDKTVIIEPQAKPATVSTTESPVITEAEETEKLENKDGPMIGELVLSNDSPLKINEIVVSEYGMEYSELEDNYDWIELKNVSNDAIKLSDYYLSDKRNEPYKYRLPDEILESGELQVIICDNEDYPHYPSCGFSLDAKAEDVFLSDSNGIVDYAHVEDVPIGGSYGRIDGEAGFFFFPTPSFDNNNENGRRFISQKCEALTKDGIYNDVDYIDVVLSGEGDIYYTLDGSLPSENSTKYDVPIRIRETTVIRAVAIQEGGLPSKPLSLTYVINENHSLNVISVVTDSPKRFEYIYSSARKNREMPGNITYFDGDSGFSQDCGIAMAGQSSVSLFPKKSLKIRFRSAYEKSRLKYDFFGTGSETGFKSICLRAGQDSLYRLFNTDMWQDLALEMNEKSITQHTEPCVLYLNGEYYGIYSIKDNVSKDFYADLMEVSSDSVEQCDMPLGEVDSFKEDVYNFIREKDLSIDENYRYVSDRIDIPSFIDWCLIEGISANEDLALNVKAFQSSEGDGKWRFVIYDLDGAMKPLGLPWELLFQNNQYGLPNNYATTILKSLIKNDEFKEELLTRYAEVYSTILSNENIVNTAEKYSSTFESEIERDRDRWGYTVGAWEEAVNFISKQVNSNDWQNLGVKILCKGHLNMTDEEILRYFPDYHPPE